MTLWLSLSAVLVLAAAALGCAAYAIRQKNLHYWLRSYYFPVPPRAAGWMNRGRCTFFFGRFATIGNQNEADQPRDQAAAVIGLLNDRARAAELGNTGQAHVRANCGWDAIAREFVDQCTQARSAG
jgi:hypothetical protein